MIPCTPTPVFKTTNYTGESVIATNLIKTCARVPIFSNAKHDDPIVVKGIFDSMEKR